MEPKNRPFLAFSVEIFNVQLDVSTFSVLTQKKSLHNFGTALCAGSLADVYSCGIVLFIMLAGFPPYNFPSKRNDKVRTSPFICGWARSFSAFPGNEFVRNFFVTVCVPLFVGWCFFLVRKSVCTPLCVCVLVGTRSQKDDKKWYHPTHALFAKKPL